MSDERTTVKDAILGIIYSVLVGILVHFQAYGLAAGLGMLIILAWDTRNER